MKSSADMKDKCIRADLCTTAREHQLSFDALNHRHGQVDMEHDGLWESEGKGFQVFVSISQVENKNPGQ